LKVFNSIQDFKSNSRTIVTLGTFDGVHIGHKKILERLVENAKKLNCESLVLTFFPHPRMVLQNDSDIKLLNTISEKTVLLENSGLDNLIIHPFDEKFSNLSAEEFVKNILVDVFKIKKIIIGHDHRFGKNRSADINDLVAFGQLYDFEVEQISPQEVNEMAVSSTKIRNALHEGNVKLANNYLGENYSISGNVVKGKQLGRTIGFPTANINVQETYKLIPKNGVYVVQSFWNNDVINGIMNIGFNPTVAGEKQTIEVYFFNFNEDIYNQNISVSFIDRLRDEQKFDSLKSLKEQLFKDQKAGMKIIETVQN
jgi:riboflavin kinase/FMN adenylyltransferase